jgi:hypothetical protein
MNCGVETNNKLSRHLLGHTEEKHENLSQEERCPGPNSTRRHFQNIRSFKPSY